MDHSFTYNTLPNFKNSFPLIQWFTRASFCALKLLFLLAKLKRDFESLLLQQCIKNSELREKKKKDDTILNAYLKASPQMEIIERSEIKAAIYKY